MASQVNSSIIQLKTSTAVDSKTDIPSDVKEVLQETINRNSNELNFCLDHLKETMERLGDYMNNCDLICPIDVRITEEPFQILFHGKDEVEK